MNDILNKPSHIISLATASILVSVDISVWSATKQDREISNEVTDSKNADQSAGRFVKNLLANNADHKAVVNYRQTVYNWLMRRTYDWNKTQRTLPHVALPRFMAEYHDHEVEFNRLLDVFLARYNTSVSDMAFKAGTMFNRNDYPTVDQVRSKFNMRLYRTEVPLGDFRCQISQDLADDMAEHYNKQAADIIQRILDDQSERMVEVLTSLSHCCDVDEVKDKDGNVKIKKRKIYDTTIDKAREMIDVYKEFNLTNDTDLEDARAKLEMALRGVTVDVLREGDVSRVQVKDAVDDILSKFAPRVATI
jgi:hypothetical protein